MCALGVGTICSLVFEGTSQKGHRKKILKLLCLEPSCCWKIDATIGSVPALSCLRYLWHPAKEVLSYWGLIHNRIVMDLKIWCCKSLCGATKTVLPLCALEWLMQTSGVSGHMPMAPGCPARAGRMVEGMVWGGLGEDWTGEQAEPGLRWGRSWGQQHMPRSYSPFPVWACFLESSWTYAHKRAAGGPSSHDSEDLQEATSRCVQRSSVGWKANLIIRGFRDKVFAHAKDQPVVIWVSGLWL